MMTEQDGFISLLEQLFPQQKIVPEGSGWSGFAFSVGDNIVRFPKANVKQYEKEALLLRFLQNKLSVKIPLPTVIHGNVDYVIHKKIQGLPWNIDSYNNLSKDANNLFCQDIATFFKELHSVSLNSLQSHIDLKEFQSTPLPSYEDFTLYLKEDLSASIVSKFYELCFDISKPQTDLVLLHNDFWEANTVVDENHRLIGVFDFANSLISERSKDFCALYHPKYLHLLQNVLEHYETITSIKINIDRIAQLKNLDLLYGVKYLAENPQIKNSMSHEWKEQINKITLLFKEEKQI